MCGAPKQMQRWVWVLAGSILGESTGCGPCDIPVYPQQCRPGAMVPSQSSPVPVPVPLSRKPPRQLRMIQRADAAVLELALAWMCNACSPTTPASSIYQLLHYRTSCLVEMSWAGAGWGRECEWDGTETPAEAPVAISNQPAQR
jgi:hypothetical protein